MKIAYLTSSLPYGPAEAFFIPEVAELQRQGHEVWLIPVRPRGPLLHDDVRPLLRRAVIQGLWAPRVLRGAAHEAARAPVSALRGLAWIARSRTPAVALKNLAVYPKALWLSRFCRRRGIEHLYAQWAATPATVAMIASEASGIPWSFTAHRWDVVEDNLLGLKLAHATHARFVCEKSMALLDGLGLRPLARRAAVLPMGVPLPASGERPTPPGPQVGRPVVLCPAAFQVRKGHRYLIEAIGLMRDRGHQAELWLAGEGETRADLEALVAALGLGDRVRFLGHLQHAALLAMYEERRVDVVALASWEEGVLCEGIPVALIEAMSFGVPVVGTASGGIPELLDRGAGVLVPQADAAALADALGKLTAEPGYRARQGRAGRKRVERAFAIDAVVAELVRRLADAPARRAA